MRFYPPGFVAFSRRRCEQFVGEGMGHLHVLAEASRRMQLEEIFNARTLNLYVYIQWRIRGQTGSIRKVM